MIMKMSYTFFFPRLLLVLVQSLLLVLFTSFALAATQLAEDEVEALKDIAKTLGKTNWNFSADPCGQEYGWADLNTVKGFENAVTCNCTLIPNSTICHVTSIVLRAQSLPGKLPPELIRLPFLQEIDLSRNYLNGTIPPEWGSLPLRNITLVANRLTGSIPVELANITTLNSLAIDFNRLSGVLPAKLGTLPKISRMLLTSNNFTGEVPETFAKLTTLVDFRINDNSFSGKIPDFIQNWASLERLAIQGSGLTGPVPSSISVLTRLTDLRISDLNGPKSSFPPLGKMKKLKILMLRSCNISGQLPVFLGDMTLKTLDLSFNMLTGEIPRSFSSLANVYYMFLTGNMLTGSVPSWLQGYNIDLSYNNFTIDSAADCEPRSGLNLFAGSSGDNSSFVPCLQSIKCQKTWDSFHINCGGKEATLNDTLTRPTITTYENDTDESGPSSFYRSRTNWASSNTGYFPDDGRSDTFIWTNSSRLSLTKPEFSMLYTQARLSSVSLTYYGFCLGNGFYKVDLHFAEIMFTNDRRYSSLGTRVFDIYIQRSRELKDFDMVKEAGGFGKEVIRTFYTHVTRNTLEIRLYWAGKGTTGIPNRGSYGPLISAVSVVREAGGSDPDPSNDSVPPQGGGSGISIGVVVAGIVAGGIFIILLTFAILWWSGFLKREKTLEQDLQGVDLQTGKFTLRQIKTATDNFDVANKIGEGGFGPVYKGLLSDGTAVAVKQLSAKSKQGNREFVNEIGMISALQHPHLVKLYGCCIEGNQLLLVYQYMENNSLARALFGPEQSHLKLDWTARHRICVGIAKGLAYLHEESRLKVVHRDIKATNVLLDRDLIPKISDFGLAKLNEEDNTHISTRIAGTFGYMAPEYAMRGYLTDKADVYSFGIVLLEIVSGRNNTTYRTNEESFYLLDWALHLKKQGKLLELVDPRLGSGYKEMMITINVALLCTNVVAANRPTMSSVVSMLECKTSVPELVDFDPNASEDEMDRMRNHFQSIVEAASEGYTASSPSVNDLYPLNPDSNC